MVSSREKLGVNFGGVGYILIFIGLYKAFGPWVALSVFGFSLILFGYAIWHES